MSATDTLFITDLDGTLLNTDAKVSPRSVAIISDLTARGAMITVATARTPATVEPLLADTRISLPAIVMTGAALWHRDTLSYSELHLMTQHNAQTVLEAMAANGLHPFVYDISDEKNMRVLRDSAPLSATEAVFVEQRKNLLLKKFYMEADLSQAPERCILMFAMGSVEAAEATAATLRAAGGVSVSCYRDTYDPRIGLVEVFGAGVSKAEAVRRMKERVGAKRLVVYGDNLNDIPMMAVADLSVAVANALPEVQSAADIVIGPNTADSVALHMASLFKA